MSYRDDRDALLSRVDALERELRGARAEVAAAQEEVAAARRKLAEARKRPAGGAPAAPWLGISPWRVGALIGIGAALTLLIVAMVMAGNEERTPAASKPPEPTVNRPVVDESLPARAKKLVAIHDCIRIMRFGLAEVDDQYRAARAAVTKGQRGGLLDLKIVRAYCLHSMREARGAVSIPDLDAAAAELDGAVAKLAPTASRAQDYYASREYEVDRAAGDTLDAELVPLVAAARRAAERAAHVAAPHWAALLGEVRRRLPDRPDGEVLGQTLEVAAAGEALVAACSDPGATWPLIEQAIERFLLALAPARSWAEARTRRSDEVWPEPFRRAVAYYVELKPLLRDLQAQAARGQPPSLRELSEICWRAHDAASGGESAVTETLAP